MVWPLLARPRIPVSHLLNGHKVRPLAPPARRAPRGAASDGDMGILAKPISVEDTSGHGLG
eukprot:4387507-Pyramimonas_sp.AAC.2